MGVELVDNKHPFPRRVSGDRLHNVRQEVRFRARRLHGGSHNPVRRHFEVGGETLRAVACVLELPPFYLPGLHWPPGARAFQSLEAGLLICTYQMGSLIGKLLSLLIDLTDSSYVPIKRFRIFVSFIV